MKEAVIYLHPDNLEKDRRYKIKYRSSKDPNVEIVKEGRFKKMSIMYIEQHPGYCLGIQLQCPGEGLNSVIAWKRITSIEALGSAPRKGKQSDSEE